MADVGRDDDAGEDEAPDVLALAADVAQHDQLDEGEQHVQRRHLPQQHRLDGRLVQRLRVQRRRRDDLERFGGLRNVDVGAVEREDGLQDGEEGPVDERDWLGLLVGGRHGVGGAERERIEGCGV